MTGILLPTAREVEIIKHCQSCWPKEACGILAGERAAPIDLEFSVVQVYPMRNVEDSPVGYSLDPAQQLQVEKQMRQRGQRLIGIYHSHTASEAYPSPVDEKFSLGPNISYVLVSLQNREKPIVKSYRIDLSKPVGQRSEEEKVWKQTPPGWRPIGMA